MTIEIYAVIVTALLAGVTFIAIQIFRKQPSEDVAVHLKAIAALNDQISTLRCENDTLIQTREAIENESKNNFNTDTGAAVAADLAD